MKIYKNVEAKKEYICDICNRPIEKGEIYTRLTTEPHDFEDSPFETNRSPYQTFHRHQKCQTSWEMLMTYMDSEYISMVYEGGIYNLLPDIFDRDFPETEIMIHLYNTLHSGEKERTEIFSLFASKGYTTQEINNFIELIDLIYERVIPNKK
jgi:hypothetical protein